MFHSPRHFVSDFGHWSKADNWTIDEGIALCLGRDPTYVSWERVQREVETSKFAFKYSRLRDLAMRSVQQGNLPDPVVPGMFVAWAERMDALIAPELKAALAARGAEAVNWEAAYDKILYELADSEEKVRSLEKSLAEALARAEELTTRTNEASLNDDQFTESLRETIEQRDIARSQLAALQSKIDVELQLDKPVSTRERETMLKLIIGMAVQGYAHDPKAVRSKATTEIASDLNRLEIGLEADTVRKWLREAANMLP
jgi:hypothetical protein